MPMYQDTRLITCFGYNILWHFFFRSRLVSLFYFETYGEDIGIRDNDRVAWARPLLHQWTANYDASNSPHCPLHFTPQDHRPKRSFSIPSARCESKESAQCKYTLPDTHIVLSQHCFRVLFPHFDLLNLREVICALQHGLEVSSLA